MRIVAISDLHGFLPEDIPDGDILVIAGDIVPDNFSDNGEYWTHDEQSEWARTKFAGWIDKQRDSFKKVLGIAGNHDFILKKYDFAYEIPWTYLHDSSYFYGGLRFHGSPWVPTFGGWAFMKPDRELSEHWDMIPNDVDVLITHGPPWGYGDLVEPYEGGKYGITEPQHVGSNSLRWNVDNQFPKLKLHIFGHIHPARGVWRVDDRTFANVSHVNSSYKPVNEAMVFDV